MRAAPQEFAVRLENVWVLRLRAERTSGDRNAYTFRYERVGTTLRLLDEIIKVGVISASKGKFGLSARSKVTHASAESSGFQRHQRSPEPPRLAAEEHQRHRGHVSPPSRSGPNRTARRRHKGSFPPPSESISRPRRGPGAAPEGRRRGHRERLHHAGKPIERFECLVGSSISRWLSLGFESIIWRLESFPMVLLLARGNCHVSTVPWCSCWHVETATCPQYT